MKNRWILTDEVKNKWGSVIKSWLYKIKNMSEEEIEQAPDETFDLDLSDTELNPYTLWKLLETIGYEQTEIDKNGWELDFWIYFKEENQTTDSITNRICVCGCGMTFDLKLTISEFM